MSKTAETRRNQASGIIADRFPRARIPVQVTSNSSEKNPPQEEAQLPSPIPYERWSSRADVINVSHMSSIETLIQTVHRLRAPGGCPWDRKQTHQSLRPYLIEEAYEVLDVLDQIPSSDKLKDEKTRGNLREELGDLLLQILLHSEMAREEGAFDFQEVAQALNDKLIRRHPHVFGDESAGSADEAYANWEKLKAQEKNAKGERSSVLDSVPSGLPALQKTVRMIERVTRVGFQWNNLDEPIGKIEEELAEWKEEVKRLEAASDSEKAKVKEKVESELGDFLFTIANVAFLMKIDPENALRQMLEKFKRRFQFVESELKKKGKKPEDSDLKEMDALWEKAKENEL